MGNKGRLVAIGIRVGGEAVEVEYGRPWEARGDRARAAVTPEAKARRYKARKDEQRALRAESRALTARYGVPVR
jgi:hypothetical protein